MIKDTSSNSWPLGDTEPRLALEIPIPKTKKGHPAERPDFLAV